MRRPATSIWSGRGWALTAAEGGVLLEIGGTRREFSALEAASLSVCRSVFRWCLRLDGTLIAVLRGLSRDSATGMRAELVRPAIDAAVAWTERVDALIGAAQAQQRWIQREHVDALLVERPSSKLSAAVAASRRSTPLDERQTRALGRLGDDLHDVIAAANDTVVATELVTMRSFFDTVESSPLTDEQAQAVICFDNRVQVVASAGSGKTSVMVARAAYAIARDFIQPERILLLAFNKDAAAELRARIDARFRAAGLDAKVEATTFHAFGLKLIGQATGAKPRLAPWVENGQDIREVADIVYRLCDSNPKFRRHWDTYRLLFAGAPTTPTGGDPDGYDKATDTQGFFTFQGEVVKSHGELMIANWLYLNEISYEYERPYVHDVATAEHSQYRPDFYYPAADVWHEHWALDCDGNPPVTTDFAGYGDGITWKRQLHQSRRTTLVESTWAEIIDGNGFTALQARLEEHGLRFDWNPERPTPGAAPVTHEDLIQFVRTFMTHVKSNSLTPELLTARLRSDRRDLGGYRAELFTGLFWQIHEEWQRRLRADNLVDFEDMLVLAADHLEAGAIDPNYQLVMVDEFQDASTARARLVRGLLQKPGRFLLAVGDDWQSINRFAGADMSVMTNFEEWFGAGPTLRLETTFRNPQAICDAAAGFVSKNPRQLRKIVRSFHSDYGPPLAITRAAVNGTEAVLEAHLKRLSAAATAGQIVPGRDGRISVKVLGRYRFDSQVMPTCKLPGIDLEFLTVHRSKGLEADYIVIPRMARGRFGFPSGISDDPLLNLVMSTPDTYAHSEERRLLYVAITRARRSVLLITETGHESPFITELINDGQAVLEGEINLQPCRKCPTGTLIARTGRYGNFHACSRFPACKHTQKLPTS